MISPPKINNLHFLQIPDSVPSRCGKFFLRNAFPLQHIFFKFDETQRGLTLSTYDTVKYSSQRLMARLEALCVCTACTHQNVSRRRGKGGDGEGGKP